MKKVLTTIAMALLVAGSTMSIDAQSRKSLRINEVMVTNENSIVDDYGKKHAWIELFNSNFAPLEISSIYITNDSTKPTLYPVPLGDVNTKMPSRQHVVFFADGEPDKGTFHTSFELVPGEDNWIGIYDADGITLIDQVVVPAGLGPDQTWARTEDGAGKWTVRTGKNGAYVTPSSANIIKDANPNVAKFAKMDKNGIAMTLMAMGIVFSALLILCLCFYGIGKIGSAVSRMNKIRATGVEVEDRHEVEHDSGEEIAAIIMALHQHLNSHDAESTILTINKVKRAYSPWSSKIYGLREIPGVHHAK